MAIVKGAIVTDFGSFETGYYIIPHTGGKFTVTGLTGLNGDVAVARYNSNGSLDTSFNSDGKVIASAEMTINTFELLSNGKYLTGGTSDDGDYAVARYNSDGSLDTAFGNGGVTETNASSGFFGLDEEAFGVLVLSNNKIMLGGYDGAELTFSAVRYTSNGNLDFSFSDDGVFNLDDFEYTLYGSVTSFAEQSNGKLLLAGSALNASTLEYDFGIIRLNENGTNDISFGDIDPSTVRTFTGTTTTDLGGNDFVSKVYALSNGKILAVGISDGDFAAVRYNNDGSLDENFGDEGIIVSDFVSNGTINRITPLKNGNFLVVGTTANNDLALARYLPDGDLDESFGDDGFVITDINNGSLDTGQNVVELDDGKILATGSSGTDMVLVRYLADGTLDTTFSSVNNRAPEGAVTITGNPVRGQTLTASHTLADPDGLGSISYQWKAGDTIVGTGNSYLVTAAALGKSITVIASYTDGLGNSESVSSPSTSEVTLSKNNAPTGTVSINDTTPQQGQILTASNSLADLDAIRGAITYTWRTGDTVLGSGANYTVTANEVGKTINVTATYTDGQGNAESVRSALTSAVTAPSTTPGFNISPSGEQSTSEAGDSVTYSVQLNTAPSSRGFVTVSFASSDTSEGTVSNPTLTFNASNWNVPQNFKVTGVNDFQNDGSIAYVVNATVSLASTDVNYRQLTIDPLQVVNKEDVTTANDAEPDDRIPLGTARDKPLKILGDAKVNTGVVDPKTGLFEVTANLNANDIISGLDGNDTIFGGNLQDELSGGIGNDELNGGDDQDFLFGDSGNDKLSGGDGIDELEGGAGNDVLIGGIDDLDSDIMSGGAGNDTYYLGFGEVDIIDDKGLNTDVDTIIMPFQQNSYTLPKGIENGTISKGSQESNLTGNEGNNNLTGNDGKNSLSGGTGRDSLFGGLGTDVLNGGAGNDSVNGGIGRDVLFGGTGQDTFVFDSVVRANTSDTVRDFKSLDDTFSLENQVFTRFSNTGAINSGNLVLGTAARDSNDFLIYNRGNGALLYDADGNGSGAAIQVAVIGTNLTLTSADFVIV
jgi:uncharacterized delta-60 repeat protein